MVFVVSVSSVDHRVYGISGIGISIGFNDIHQSFDSGTQSVFCNRLQKIIDGVDFKRLEAYSS